MILHNILESIKLFIILNPIETAVLLIVVCTWTGSYLESVFKFWDWGPQCNKCNEWVLWDDSKVHCTKCDYEYHNDAFQAGLDT